MFCFFATIHLSSNVSFVKNEHSLVGWLCFLPSSVHRAQVARLLNVVLRHVGIIALGEFAVRFGYCA